MKKQCSLRAQKAGKIFADWIIGTIIILDNSNLLVRVAFHWPEGLIIRKSAFLKMKKGPLVQTCIFPILQGPLVRKSNCFSQSEHRAHLSESKFPFRTSGLVLFSVQRTFELVNLQTSDLASLVSGYGERMFLKRNEKKEGKVLTQPTHPGCSTTRARILLHVKPDIDRFPNLHK